MARINAPVQSTSPNGAGKTAIVGPFDRATFNQPSGADAGMVYVNADGTQTEISILPFKD
jgi:hypothetical protein